MSMGLCPTRASPAREPRYELEKCYGSISFLKPATNWSIIYDFKQNGHVTNHVTY